MFDSTIVSADFRQTKIIYDKDVTYGLSTISGAPYFVGHNKTLLEFLDMYRLEMENADCR